MLYPKWRSWRRKWQPTPVLLPGKSHGWRSLVGYSPWGHKESDTEWATSLHDTWRGPSSQIRFIYHTYISQLHWLLISSHYQPCKSWSTSLSTAKGSTEVWWSWRNTLDSNSWISFFLISHSVTSDSLRPHGILQARILEWVAVPFSRGIFPTQGSNPGLPHCRWILYKLSHKRSPVK